MKLALSILFGIVGLVAAAAVALWLWGVWAFSPERPRSESLVRSGTLENGMVFEIIRFTYRITTLGFAVRIGANGIANTTVLYVDGGPLLSAVPSRLYLMDPKSLVITFGPSRVNLGSPVVIPLDDEGAPREWVEMDSNGAVTRHKFEPPPSASPGGETSSP